MSGNKVHPITTQPQAGDDPFKSGSSSLRGSGKWRSSGGDDLDILSERVMLVATDSDLLKEYQDDIEHECHRAFSVKTGKGKDLYHAIEERTSCYCCNRDGFGFILHIYDDKKQKVLKAIRPSRSCTYLPCCCLGCAHHIILEKPDGDIVGFVTQRFCGGYKVQDANKKTILQIDYTTCCGKCCECECESCCRPCCSCGCFRICVCGCLIKPIIYNTDNDAIGFYSNVWPRDIVPEFETRERRFGILSPVDLEDRKHDLLLVGGMLLNAVIFDPARPCCGCCGNQMCLAGCQCCMGDFETFFNYDLI